MTASSVSQATQALTISRAIKTRWHSASRREDGSYQMAPAHSERRVRSLIPWRRATAAMVEAELRQRVALAEDNLQSSRPPLMTCGHSETLGRRWRRPAYDRLRLGKARGHGFGQPDDKVKVRGPASEGMDAMQLELSNFQPLAANEAIEEEAPDLGGAEQLSAADDRRK